MIKQQPEKQESFLNQVNALSFSIAITIQFILMVEPWKLVSDDHFSQDLFKDNFKKFINKYYCESWIEDQFSHWVPLFLICDIFFGLLHSMPIMFESSDFFMYTFRRESMHKLPNYSTRRNFENYPWLFVIKFIYGTIYCFFKIEYFMKLIILKYKKKKVDEIFKDRLFKQRYDKRRFPRQLGDICNICLNKFTPNDKLIQLYCNRAHFFHANCLLERTDLNCPTCYRHIDRRSYVRIR